MKPIIYDKGEAVFASNGLGRLNDCISATVEEEMNGIYELDFEIPADGSGADLVQPGRIIAVSHDESGDIQPFDIVSYSRPINGVITYHAEHISYRQRKLTVAGSGVNSLTDAFALLATAEPSNPFTYSADFTATGYLAAADGIPRSVRQILGGIEGSILDAYGGEYEFDKFNVILHQHRGQARDFTIRYGVNLLDYNEDTDYADTYASCIPYWKGNENGSDVIVIGDRTDTGKATYNGRNDCIPLDLSEKFEDKPTKAQLQTAALSYMTANQTTMPAQTIKVNFIRLQDMGYDWLGSLLECNLCDSVNVSFPKYGMAGTYKIVKTTWDVLEERYTEMELGHLSTTLAEALGITSAAETLDSINDLAIAGDLAVGGDAAVTGGLTIGGDTMGDFVIEKSGTGANNTWNYRKWSSGILECWGRFYISSMNISSTSGQLRYASVTITDSTYPIAFKVYPTVEITGQVTNGNGWVVGNNTNYSTTSVGGLYAYAPTAQTGVGVTVNIYAIGYWK